MQSGFFIWITLLEYASGDQGIHSILTDMQPDDGSWLSSSVLLVPAQFKENAPGPAYPDIRRVISTAMALIGLKTVLAVMRRMMN